MVVLATTPSTSMVITQLTKLLPTLLSTQVMEQTALLRLVVASLSTVVLVLIPLLTALILSAFQTSRNPLSTVQLAQTASS